MEIDPSTKVYSVELLGPNEKKMRTLNDSVSHEEDLQHGVIFRTHCTILKRVVCSRIINGGSCTYTESHIWSPT